MFFFFKQKTAYEISACLVGSQMCIRDSFMLKEIFEQPDTVRNTMRGRLLNESGAARLGGLNLTTEELLKFDNILITACGTSWHSALIGEFLIEELARVPVEVEYASELRYRNPIISDKTLCI